jgi:Ca2+-binding RTX toxin-like protein
VNHPGQLASGTLETITMAPITRRQRTNNPARDHRNRSLRRRPRLENLETRKLMASLESLEDQGPLESPDWDSELQDRIPEQVSQQNKIFVNDRGVLVVEGTRERDVIEFNLQRGDRVLASLRDYFGELIEQSSFDLSEVSRIYAHGSDQNDQIINNTWLDATFHGGEGHDTLIGGSGNDTLDGDAGSDELEGGPGNDTLRGGDHQDTLRGGAGQDVLRGENGNDTLHGDGESDELYGGEGRDTLFGGPGNDSLYGDQDVDELHGGDGDDTLFGGSGDDGLHGDGDDDVLYGESGNDALNGGDGRDTLWGGADNDRLDGGGLDDTLHGESGNDTLRGNAGRDYLFGGDHDDSLFGDEGFDILRGQSGHDTLRGGDDTDILYGGDGNDDLRGDDGTDYLYGEQGLDGLFGGGDRDFLDGGTEVDRFLYQIGDVFRQQDAEDAVISFEDTKEPFEFESTGQAYDPAAWQDSEIEIVDVALKTIHLRTGSAIFLRDADKGNYAFQRYGKARFVDEDLSNASSGWNPRYSPHIAFTDYAFLSGAEWTYQTVFHEIGHDWDSVDENSLITDFRALSGWTTFVIASPVGPQYVRSGDNQWWHFADAQFARDYGAHNPYEDWATVFAAVWMQILNDEMGITVEYIDNQIYTSQPDSVPEKLALVRELIDSKTIENHLA